MYAFEGNFRQAPKQSLGGASKKEEKDDLLKRTQEERKKRENQRRRLRSTIIIQSFFRGCKERETQRNVIRSEFDHLCNQVQLNAKLTGDTNMLSSLIRSFLFFYKPQVDQQRLTWLCQHLVRQHDTIASYVCTTGMIGLLQIQHVLWICCRHLDEIAKSTSPLAVGMRMLEVYSTPKTYANFIPHDKALALVHSILQFLVKKGYFKVMKVLIEEKIPSSLERTINPPTPMAGSILDLVKTPILHIADYDDPEFRNLVLQSVCKELLGATYSEQVSQFILPALAYGREPFPFVDLLHALLPVFEKATSESKTNTPDSLLEEKDTSISCNWKLSVEPSLWLLSSVLHLGQNHLGTLNRVEIQRYLAVLHRLVPKLYIPKNNLDDDDSDGEDYMDVDLNELDCNLSEIRQECIKMLNQPQYIKGIISTVSRDPDPGTITAICTVCHTLMAHNKLLVHKTRLLYTLAFNPKFVKNLWYTCATVSTKTVTGSKTTLLQMLSRGMQMAGEDLERIVPLLSVFCSLFSHSLMSLHDADFFRDEDADQTDKLFSMPFDVKELVPMSQALRDACVGIIELAHPDTKPLLREDLMKAFHSVGVQHNTLSLSELQQQRDTWAYIFKMIVQLVKQMYARDTRRRYCPEGHWLSNLVNIQADKPSQLYRAQNSVFIRRPFGALSALNTNREMDEEGPPLSTTEVRNLTVLTELPFVVPFSERVKIFHKMIQQDRIENQGEVRHLMGGPMINANIRRNYLYEDAFEKLSVQNEPNLKLKIQVQLINFAGLDEAGIDGGGLFREFIAELLKTSFDPNRGFFKLSNDNLLYPNPAALKLVENFTAHYFFLGRILAKAIYEGMLVELPFASFFMSKILSRSRGDVDFHHLQSLDPEMYRNLLFLRNYEGDLAELGLDFTVVNNELGEAQVEELKPGGKDIPVTSANHIEYIHLMADYRLNRQIRAHCNAFRQGMADVLNMDWLRMFDHRELQTLISGAEVPVDVDDLRKHTNYSGGYTADHQIIKQFWEAVEGFTDKQKRQLLKFVTSCSRPPLLGFKDLYPAFCIHHGGNEERLPSASTCMNLLKLPHFKTFESLREKLLYAVESGAGFELS